MQPELREIYDNIRNMEPPEALATAREFQTFLRNAGDIDGDVKDRLIALLVNQVILLEIRVAKLESAAGGA
ncbi:hypothetical protein ACEWX3_07710 [Mycobacterium sp. G7A2]|uniref:hypothetical protein n=1 Tax=Mycobacterium sp. G7A2 TaxID=3317307 RepID=UPI0035A986BB